MTLILTMLRCLDGVPPETRQIEHGELTIGRGRDSDWVLPDPERLLSKRHCTVTWRGDRWELTDISTNGTCLNHESECLGRNMTRTLQDGDRLILGAHEIEVALRNSTFWQRPDEAAPALRSSGQADGESGSGAISLPIALPPDVPLDVPLGDALGIAMRSLSGSHDDDPFASPLPAADHAPVGAEHFRPPAARLNVLPPDWDQSLVPHNYRADLPSAESPSLKASVLVPAISGSANSSSVPPVQASSLPVKLPAIPAASVSASPGLVQATPPGPEQPDPIVPTPDPVALGPADAYAAFLGGAGITAPTPADAAAALHGLGQAFRIVVSGLRQVIITRAAIKGEFRIEQTMIQPSGNNPLKFSADDDDALQALLGSRRLGDMPAGRALDEAMRDLRSHEIAVSAAMQQATRDLLAALAPGRVERDLPTGTLDKLPGTAAWRKARSWDRYVTLHARAMQALDDDFDSIFGKSFVRAYEQAMAELDAQDGGGEDAAVPRRVK